MTSAGNPSEEEGAQVPPSQNAPSFMPGSTPLPIGPGGWQPSPLAPGRQVDGTCIYDRLGGPEPFWRVARAFYARIERHPTLRGIFPDDLQEPIRNQAEFLIQYFGGPHAYSERKGHPRLRMRHMAFKIDPAARDAWVATMRLALEDAAIPTAERIEMLRYFEHAATFLVNAPEAGQSSRQ